MTTVTEWITCDLWDSSAVRWISGCRIRRDQIAIILPAEDPRWADQHKARTVQGWTIRIHKDDAAKMSGTTIEGTHDHLAAR